MLKVDRSFVARLADGARQRRLFASGSGLRMRLACGRAPRASRRASSEEVVRNGCDAVQGYFVCRPASAGALDDCLVHPPTHAAV